MRKIIYLIHMSLDGFVAGPNGEMDWIGYNEELEHYVHALHHTTDAAIYGRVTYQMMESYWPSVLTNPSSAGGDLAHAQWLDRATKIVFSRSLQSVEWKNTVLIHDNIKEEMTKIKQQPGKNLWLIGSPSIGQAFMQHGLIDEYWINVNPVVLGSGKPLFAGMNKTLNLKLLESRTFGGGIGVTALRYATERT
jgi:dihydrofolate reductase